MSDPHHSDEAYVTLATAAVAAQPFEAAALHASSTLLTSALNHFWALCSEAVFDEPANTAEIRMCVLSDSRTTQHCQA